MHKNGPQNVQDKTMLHIVTRTGRPEKNKSATRPGYYLRGLPVGQLKLYGAKQNLGLWVVKSSSRSNRSKILNSKTHNKGYMVYVQIIPT